MLIVAHSLAEFARGGPGGHVSGSHQLQRTVKLSAQHRALYGDLQCQSAGLSITCPHVRSGSFSISMHLLYIATNILAGATHVCGHLHAAVSVQLNSGGPACARSFPCRRKLLGNTQRKSPHTRHPIGDHRLSELVCEAACSNDR